MIIELKKWTAEDSRSLIQICDQADRTFLSDRMPKPYTQDAARWWLNMVAERDGKHGVFRRIVADGITVGNITVEKKEDVYQRDAEIGYFLLREAWGKGIMTEAARQICEIAFRELDLMRITGAVYAPNSASRRVLEKNGFILEGTLRNAVTKDGNIWDLCIYGKLKNE